MKSMQQCLCLDVNKKWTKLGTFLNKSTKTFPECVLGDIHI